MVRFGLPEIDFINVDPEELEAIAVAKFEEMQNVSLDEGDPRRKFMQSIIFVGTLLANGIDFAGKQNLLAYAVDNHLDHFGVKRNVSRLKPGQARATFRFELNNPEQFIIPAGIRFIKGNVVFRLEEDTLVDIGTRTVDIEAICEEVGTIGNGFAPGQITDIVDPLPWVSKAYNITKTEGGSDWEEDDPYADRIRLSNSQYSTAGPEGAYEFHAKSANSSIVNVSVSSPSPGVVLIVPLLKNGGIPGQEVLDQVKEKLSDRKVRPLTDLVLTEAPTIIPYEINVTYYIPLERSMLMESIKADINKAIAAYEIWQKSKLGRDVDLSALISAIRNAGGVRISLNQVTTSTYIGVAKNQVAIASSVISNFGGLADD